MSKVVKVIEVLAQSSKSWEDAAAQAVAKVGKSVDHVKSINIINMNVKVEKGKIVSYRINAKVSFAVEKSKSHK